MVWFEGWGTPPRKLNKHHILLPVNTSLCFIVSTDYEHSTFVAQILYSVTYLYPPLNIRFTSLSFFNSTMTNCQILTKEVIHLGWLGVRYWQHFWKQAMLIQISHLRNKAKIFDKWCSWFCIAMNVAQFKRRDKMFIVFEIWVAGCFPDKMPVMRNLVFSLLLAYTCCWANIRTDGDLNINAVSSLYCIVWRFVEQ